MTIKSVRILSLGKILGCVYAGLGLIFGFIFAAVALAGIGPAVDDSVPAIIGLLMGGGAVIFLPLVYGFFGFVGGLVVGTIYNLAAKLVGGLEIETG